MMNSKKKERLRYIFPTAALSALAGAIVGVVIVLFKLCAGYAVHACESIYGAARENPLLLIVIAAAAALAALGYTLLYRKIPNARGGGIPTSVGILRGIISFRWLGTLFSVFFASLVTFLFGVPLGTEGPSVQIGTALGRGVSRTCAKNDKALDRYIMTGGASAGFTVATGSPVAGLVFALEEAHQRISPLIFLSASAAVVAAKTVSDLLSPVFGVSPMLFEQISIGSLTAKDYYIPVTVAIAVGLLSVLFLKAYKVISTFWSKKLSKIPAYVTILAILLLTVAAGFFGDMFISTGHHLSDELLHASLPIYMLLICFVVRAVLMIIASKSGITGGMFLPILALGALSAATVGSIFMLLGLDASYYPVIVMLGMTAAVAGMMKMPLTALVFGIEALSLSGNILPVIITVGITYLITEVFSVNSITEKVLESRIHHMHGGMKPHVYETFVTVREGAFSVGKQVRDVLWPSDLIILSLKRADNNNVMADKLGEAVIHAGDVLHLRYPTYDIDTTHSEISALVGSQEYSEEEIKKI